MAPKQNNTFVDLLLNVIIPSIILMKFSTPDRLGPTNGLLVALAFPLCYGLYEFIKKRNYNFFSILGFVSTLLTGGIGLMKLDPQWVAVKEAAIPLFIALAILASMKTQYPLVKTLFAKMINLDRIRQAAVEKGAEEALEKRMANTSYLIAGSFFLSAFLNFSLAKWIVVSPAGTPAFNEELGKLTALSYPVIAIPCTLVMVGALFYLFQSIHRLTGLDWQQLMD